MHFARDYFEQTLQFYRDCKTCFVFGKKLWNMPCTLQENKVCNFQKIIKHVCTLQDIIKQILHFARDYLTCIVLCKKWMNKQEIMENDLFLARDYSTNFWPLKEIILQTLPFARDYWAITVVLLFSKAHRDAGLEPGTTK